MEQNLLHQIYLQINMPKSNQNLLFVVAAAAVVVVVVASFDWDWVA